MMKLQLAPAPAKTACMVSPNPLDITGLLSATLLGSDLRLPTVVADTVRQATAVLTGDYNGSVEGVPEACTVWTELSFLSSEFTSDGAPGHLVLNVESHTSSDGQAANAEDDYVNYGLCFHVGPALTRTLRGYRLIASLGGRRLQRNIVRGCNEPGVGPVMRYIMRVPLRPYNLARVAVTLATS